ncbi:MAG: hypothetical protein ISR59_01040 [Anaerolineales bacterium]|uniref:Uncharacterized protein n=1 Tax=Candidatus Desulfolinea nitratireducens TaxID=2841698 RepID=A0A8J6TH75_9CHLR|nr:hypothetical protein [Candidatus Desulfolinea nitratireducens]MBL6959663.1 hypothetical protein [Anaerolineales bacterium]
MQKITKLIDIEAPCQDVFDTVVDIDRRMQLSPLWGLSQLLDVSPNYPQTGSSYRVRVLTDMPFGLSYGTLNATQGAISGLIQMLSLKSTQADTSHSKELISDDAKEIIATSDQEPEFEMPARQEYFVTEHELLHKFSYYLDEDCKTIITWRFQSIPLGTRINYEEVFCDENIGGENFIPTVRGVISEWLFNIKRYSELNNGRGRQIIKWFLDRYYLKLRPDQRRVVLMTLYMQAIGLATFMIALIGWGIASLFF